MQFNCQDPSSNSGIPTGGINTLKGHKWITGPIRRKRIGTRPQGAGQVSPA